MAHRIVNADSLPPPVGFAHAVVAAPGRTVYLAGQIASDATGTCHGDTVVEQFGLALDNVVAALGAAGGKPEDIVSLHVFVTDVDAYRESLRELGREYRARLGKHYPAMALFGVSALFDPASLVELVATAVIPA